MEITDGISSIKTVLEVLTFSVKFKCYKCLYFGMDGVFFFLHLCDYFSSISLTLLFSLIFSSEDYSSCTVSSTSNHRFWLELACVLFHADVEVGVRA